MSKLERWLPFSFKKKTHKDKQQQAQAASSEGRALAQPAQQHPLAPFAPMFSRPMQQLMQGFFDDPFFGTPLLPEAFGGLDQLDRWFGDFAPSRFTPSIEVSDEGKALKVTAELPGMDKDDVELQIDGDTLVISGEKKSESDSEDEGVFRTERYYGYFQRAIPLPEDLDRDKAEAEFKNGVLTIRFPKLEETGKRTRRIEIKR